MAKYSIQIWNESFLILQSILHYTVSRSSNCGKTKAELSKQSTAGVSVYNKRWMNLLIDCISGAYKDHNNNMGSIITSRYLTGKLCSQSCTSSRKIKLFSRIPCHLPISTAVHLTPLSHK